MTNATITIFKIVPSPGVCLSGYQKISTTELIIKVAVRTLTLMCFPSPSARTVQGLTPEFAASKNASPNPNKLNPTISMNVDRSGGRKVSVFGELQNRVGMDRTFKNFI